MTSLLNKALFKNSVLRRATYNFINSARNVNNADYKPGPYPRTLEERAKAAKTYGMSIEEYQPYPEEMGYGDYPRLPDIGADSKDVHYPYDCPEMKRNFNEPIHVKSEIIGEDRHDISFKPRYAGYVQLAAFLTFVGGSFVLFFFLEDYKMGRPVTIKQYPKEGPFYTFNPQ